MILRACQSELRFPGPVQIMGVVNVTPDSFFDGGQYFAPARAVEHALRLVNEGAGVIDIGGESSRPGAPPVPEDEELRRVMPVLEGLQGKLQIPISIDTAKPAVARKALAAGAVIINDIAANREDPAMWEAAAETGAGYVAMHMRGTPNTMQERPIYHNVVTAVDDFFADRLQRLQRYGVQPQQVVLDVGIGFGKRLGHNLQLLAALKHYRKFERPLALGVSRKSFIGHLLGLTPQERMPAGLACAVWAALEGIHIIRTHDVAATVQAVRMIEAIRNAADNKVI